MKVLSVDDSSIMRKIIRSVVDMLGYDFAEAGNGQEALDLLATDDGKDIELILLDVNMPVMDGLTTLKTLKADKRFSQIPVVMVTTEGERINIVNAIKLGAKNYVVKPFSPEELASKIMESSGASVF